MGVAVGSGYLYKTTFEKEVYSDLYGERGCLMGGIHGMFLAQYEVLRERGHSPSEAFNETVEEATQSLYPLIGANGMDWMYAACSTTARRGAIDWSSRFKDTLKPVFNDLYDSVRDGKETQRSLDYNSQSDYREKYEKEMQDIRDLEIWRAGKAVRYVAQKDYPSFTDEIAGLSVQRITCESNDWVVYSPFVMLSHTALYMQDTKDLAVKMEKRSLCGYNFLSMSGSGIYCNSW